MVRYSSKRRASSTTTSAFSSSNACTSSADSAAMWRRDSVHSPNAFVNGVVPILQRRGIFRTEYSGRHAKRSPGFAPAAPSGDRSRRHLRIEVMR